MTKDKFRDLCDEVLIPRLGDLMRVQLIELQQVQDVLASELVRIGNKLDWLATRLADRDSYDDLR